MPRRSQNPDPVLVTLPDAVDLIRFEKNLLQIGFFGAHERRGRQAVSSRRIEQWVNRDGKKIKVSAEFRSSDALGLPSTSDRDKYMAFMKLAMESRLRNGVITNPIRFSGYSLLNALGQCDSGENYEALNSWGMRMADTTITSEQVIYSSLRKRYMNKTVHVFRSFTRLGSSALDGTNKVDMFEVELEDWLLENLNESFVVPEDFNMYRKLVRPTAKGIFVYLYVWFYASQGKEVEKDYTELCALLNVRAYDHLSKIRETMGLSLTDLVNIGYLKSWDIRPMTSKAGYKLVLSPGRAMRDVLLLTQRKQLAFAAGHMQEETTKGSNPEPFVEARERAKASLIEHGVSEKKASELVRKLEPTALAERIAYVAAQVKADGQRKIKNPAGYLIRFAEDEQPIPASFSGCGAHGNATVLVSAREEKAAAHAEASLDEMHAREEYSRWLRSEVEAHMADHLDKEIIAQRVKAVSSRLRKDPSLASALDRMKPEVRRAEVLSALRKDIARELNLPTFSEWLVANPQGALFYS